MGTLKPANRPDATRLRLDQHAAQRRVLWFTLVAYLQVVGYSQLAKPFCAKEPNTLPPGSRLAASYPCDGTQLDKLMYLAIRPVQVYQDFLFVQQQDAWVAASAATMMVRVGLGLLAPRTMMQRWGFVVHRMVAPLTLLVWILLSDQEPTSLALWFTRSWPLLDCSYVLLFPTGVLPEAVYGVVSFLISALIGARIRSLHPHLPYSLPAQLLACAVATALIIYYHVVWDRWAARNRAGGSSTAGGWGRGRGKAGGAEGDGAACRSGSRGEGAEAAAASMSVAVSAPTTGSEEISPWDRSWGGAAGDSTDPNSVDDFFAEAAVPVLPRDTSGGADDAKAAGVAAAELDPPKTGTCGTDAAGSDTPPCPTSIRTAAHAGSAQPGQGNGTAGGATAAAAAVDALSPSPSFVSRYTPVLRVMRLQVKIQGADPEQVSPGYERRIAGVVEAAGFELGSLYLRRGCIELVVNARRWVLPESPDEETAVSPLATARYAAAAMVEVTELVDASLAPEADTPDAAPGGAPAASGDGGAALAWTCGRAAPGWTHDSSSGTSGLLARLGSGALAASLGNPRAGGVSSGSRGRGLGKVVVMDVREAAAAAAAAAAKVVTLSSALPQAATGELRPLGVTAAAAAAPQGLPKTAPEGSETTIRGEKLDSRWAGDGDVGGGVSGSGGGEMAVAELPGGVVGGVPEGSGRRPSDDIDIGAIILALNLPEPGASEGFTEEAAPEENGGAAGTAAGGGGVGGGGAAGGPGGAPFGTSSSAVLLLPQPCRPGDLWPPVGLGLGVPPASAPGLALPGGSLGDPPPWPPAATPVPPPVGPQLLGVYPRVLHVNPRAAALEPASTSPFHAAPLRPDVCTGLTPAAGAEAWDAVSAGSPHAGVAGGTETRRRPGLVPEQPYYLDVLVWWPDEDGGGCDGATALDAIRTAAGVGGGYGFGAAARPLGPAEEQVELLLRSRGAHLEAKVVAVTAVDLPQSAGTAAAAVPAAPGETASQGVCATGSAAGTTLRYRLEVPYLPSEPGLLLVEASGIAAVPVLVLGDAPAAMELQAAVDQWYGTPEELDDLLLDVAAFAQDVAAAEAAAAARSRVALDGGDVPLLAAAPAVNGLGDGSGLPLVLDHRVLCLGRHLLGFAVQSGWTACAALLMAQLSGAASPPGPARVARLPSANSALTAPRPAPQPVDTAGPVVAGAAPAMQAPPAPSTASHPLDAVQLDRCDIGTEPAAAEAAAAANEGPHAGSVPAHSGAPRAAFAAAAAAAFAEGKEGKEVKEEKAGLGAGAAWVEVRHGPVASSDSRATGAALTATTSATPSRSTAPPEGVASRSSPAKYEAPRRRLFGALPSLALVGALWAQVQGAAMAQAPAPAAEAPPHCSRAELTRGPGGLDETEQGFRAYKASWRAAQALFLQWLDVGLLLTALWKLGGEWASGGTAPPHAAFTAGITAVGTCAGVASMAAWAVLPPLVWTRFVDRCVGLRQACSCLVKVLVGWSGQAMAPCLSKYELGLGVWLMEGVILPGSCMLSPAPSLLLSLAKVPLLMRSWLVLGGGAEAPAPRRNQEAVLHACGVACLSFGTTVACHWYLCESYRRRLRDHHRRRTGVKVE